MKKKNKQEIKNTIQQDRELNCYCIEGAITRRLKE